MFYSNMTSYPLPLLSILNFNRKTIQLLKLNTGIHAVEKMIVVKDGFEQSTPKAYSGALRLLGDLIDVSEIFSLLALWTCIFRCLVVAL